MKKIILSLFLLLTSLSFAMSGKIKQDLPEAVEKEIRAAVSNQSGSDKREYFNWYKDSYLELMTRLENSGIPKQDADTIARRLHAMYGSNYPKQLSSVNDEIADYKNLVQRIRDEQKIVQQKIEEENMKNKAEIREILDNSNIDVKDLKNIELNARKEFPDNYSLQKAYIKGAIQTYLELKNMIKK